MCFFTDTWAVLTHCIPLPTDKSLYIDKDGKLSFAQMLHSIRTTDEVSQTELAKLVGVFKGLVCDIEKWIRLPTIEQAANMAISLGYPVEGFVSILIQEQLKKANLKMKVTLKKAS